MILNQRHQRNIIQAAGFDVLAHSGFPNYPKPKPIARYADGASFGIAPLHSASKNKHEDGSGFSLEFHNCNFTPESKAYLNTPDGQRHVIAIAAEAGRSRTPRKVHFR